MPIFVFSLTACNQSTPPATAPTVPQTEIGRQQPSSAELEEKFATAQREFSNSNFGNALKLVNEYLNNSPSRADAYLLRGRIQSVIGDTSAAAISIEEALKAGISTPEKIFLDPALNNLLHSDHYKPLVERYPMLASQVSKKVNGERGKTVVRAGGISIQLPSD